MLILVPDRLYSGTLKHQILTILITNFKVTLSMALWTKPLETWEVLAAPNSIRQTVATTTKSQKHFHSRGSNPYLYEKQS